MKVMVKQQKGFSVISVLIALVIGLYLLLAIGSLFSSLKTTQQHVAFQWDCQSKAQFVLELLSHYASLDGFGRRVNSQAPSSNFTDEDWTHMHAYVSKKIVKGRQPLVFQMKLPPSEIYSCEGSWFESPAIRSAIQSVATVFWVRPEGSLVCKTWVKLDGELCEMPIKKGYCSVNRVSPEALVGNISNFSWKKMNSGFLINIGFESGLNNKITGVAFQTILTTNNSDLK